MRIIISLITLVTTLILGSMLYRHESERRAMKEDLIELLQVKYGMFNVDEWKRILSDLLSKKIEELDVSGGNRDQMRADVTNFLDRAVTQLEQEVAGSGSMKGMLLQTLGVFDEVRKYIPRITDQVLEFMSSPENRDRVKGFIKEKIDEYSAKTFAEVDYTQLNSILLKYKYQTRDEAIVGLQEKIGAINNDVLKYTLLSVIGLFLVWTIFSKQMTNHESLILIVICLTLLIFGVLLPMIEIDARISSISLTLLGEPIKFTDQVLYYKSKSILEVVRLMFTQGRVDVLFVGMLVLLFSVLFPVAKLICSIIYVYAPSMRDSKVLDFIVFKTGKWSMADVMVVAIFMAYIGFGGIISDQLRQLEGISENIDILTTNKSSLQLGFYLFTSFTVLSLVASQKIQGSLK